MGPPSLDLDFGEIESERRFEAWRAANDGLYDLKNLTPDGSTWVRVQSWRPGALVVGRYGHGPSIAQRVPGALEERLIIRLYLRGQAQVLLEGEPITMAPGALHIFDAREDYRSITDDKEYLSVTLPWEAIGYDPSRHRVHRALPLETPLGRLLRVNLDFMIEAMPTVKAREAISLADGFSGLLATLLADSANGEPQRAQFEEARDRQVRRLIEEHLRDPDLDVAKICRLAGVSRSTLYRIFEPLGGVVGYVLGRRLEAAMRDLSQSAPRRGIVAEVAQRWAIDDPSLFGRQFRGHFGVRPSDVVGTKLSPESKALSDRGSGGLPTSVPPLSILYR